MHKDKNANQLHAEQRVPQCSTCKHLRLQPNCPFLTLTDSIKALSWLPLTWQQ